MRIEIGDDVEAVQDGDTIILRAARAPKIISSAVAVVEERYRGGDWQDLNEKIGELATTLHDAGYGKNWEFYS